MGLREILGEIITLFAIVNPIGALSIIDRIAPNMNPQKRTKVFNHAVITGAFILILFSFIGKAILEEVFHLSINDFLIAAGLILLVISIKSIVFHRFTKQEMDSFVVKDFGSFPVAFPLLVGPGALVAGVLTLQKHGLPATIFIIVCVFCLVFFVLRFMDNFVKILGPLGLRVISKIMYVFLGAIAVKYIINGVVNYFKV
ncbi:MAG: hypothetical protein A2044_08625 [Candidatus Firestonebacteria bacterium GWA2_43_8]|nr:MAG: hypothetical protein A2044_08625 [Candidatus Firestonebacteria bacterium GWA2_43_8]